MAVPGASGHLRPAPSGPGRCHTRAAKDSAGASDPHLSGPGSGTSCPGRGRRETGLPTVTRAGSGIDVNGGTTYAARIPPLNTHLRAAGHTRVAASHVLVAPPVGDTTPTRSANPGYALIAGGRYATHRSCPMRVCRREADRAGAPGKTGRMRGMRAKWFVHPAHARCNQQLHKADLHFGRMPLRIASMTRLRAHEAPEAHAACARDCPEPACAARTSTPCLHEQFRPVQWYCGPRSTCGTVNEPTKP